MELRHSRCRAAHNTRRGAGHGGGDEGGVAKWHTTDREAVGGRSDRGFEVVTVDGGKLGGREGGDGGAGEMVGAVRAWSDVVVGRPTLELVIHHKPECLMDPAAKAGGETSADNMTATINEWRMTKILSSCVRK